MDGLLVSQHQSECHVSNVAPDLRVDPWSRGIQGKQAPHTQRPHTGSQVAPHSRDVTDGSRLSRAGKVQRQTQHQRQSAEEEGNSTVSVSSECKSPPAPCHFGSRRRRHASRDATAPTVTGVTMWCNPKVSCAWSPESIFTPDWSVLVRQPSDSHSSDYSRLIQMFLEGGGGCSGKFPWICSAAFKEITEQKENAAKPACKLQ